MSHYCQSASRMMIAGIIAAGLIQLSAAAGSAIAQTYSYLPTARTDDGRFFSIAGTGIQTLGDNPLLFKIAVPASAANVEIGIFDGNTGGMWDQGTTPLLYTLVADPSGDATGTLQLGQWNGGTMPDNAWYTATVPNSSQARCGSGTYYYTLRVSSTNITTMHWSSFKLRTNGTIVVQHETNLAYTAPLGCMEDAQTVYPSYPTLAPSTYDGTWNFYMDVPVALASLTLYDGDMDRGSFDCSDNDTDDPDTPNSLPSWATTFAVAEGVATSAIGCENASGTPTGGTTTSNPPDDSRNPAFRRGSGVTYEIVSPNGTHFANANPSGNLEWEQFRISTGAFDRATMDYHADALPAGTYKLHVDGVDLSNLNAWRFPYDVMGVDAAGLPVVPLRPDFTDGVISGVVYYESNDNGHQDAGEPGIPSVTVTLTADYNGDGKIDATSTVETNVDGIYTFAGLHKGAYVITVDAGTLADDVAPVWDTDGMETRNTVTSGLTMCSRTSTGVFGYKRVAPTGTRTRGYWVNHPDAWPVNTLRLGAVYYSKAELIGILERPTRGDKTYSLAAQLIATKLNLADGCESSCIANTVADADAWLTTYPVGSNVKNNAVGDAIQTRLDDYNNGRLCVGHMK